MLATWFDTNINTAPSEAKKRDKGVANTNGISNALLV